MPLIEDLEIKGLHQKVILSSHVATVLDEKKWSRTEVSSSGGGGYINRDGGYITAPTISSTSVQEQEAWFELEGGRHYCMRLVDSNFSALPGHDVSIISVSANGQDCDVGVLNRTSGKWHSFVNNEQFFIEKIQGSPLSFWAYLLFVVALSFLLPSMVLSSLENVNAMTNLKRSAESIEWRGGVAYAEAGLAHLEGGTAKTQAQSVKGPKGKKKLQEDVATNAPTDYNKSKKELSSKLTWLLLLPGLAMAILVWFLRGAKFNAKVAHFSAALDDFVTKQRGAPVDAAGRRNSSSIQPELIESAG